MAPKRAKIFADTSPLLLHQFFRVAPSILLDTIDSLAAANKPFAAAISHDMPCPIVANPVLARAHLAKYRLAWLYVVGQGVFLRMGHSRLHLPA